MVLPLAKVMEGAAVLLIKDRAQSSEHCNCADQNVGPMPTLKATIRALGKERGNATAWFAKISIFLPRESRFECKAQFPSTATASRPMPERPYFRALLASSIGMIAPLAGCQFPAPLFEPSNFEEQRRAAVFKDASDTAGKLCSVPSENIRIQQQTVLNKPDIFYIYVSCIRPNQISTKNVDCFARSLSIKDKSITKYYSIVPQCRIGDGDVEF